MLSPSKVPKTYPLGRWVTEAGPEIFKETNSYHITVNTQVHSLVVAIKGPAVFIGISTATG